MQTPAGYEIAADGSKAIITNFWEAAFNPSTAARYFHTVDSLLIFGAFVAMAIGAYHLLKKRNAEFGRKTLHIGAVVAVITLILMIPAAHQQAVVVAENQPTKFASMEGQWESGPAPLSLFGWVDEETKTTTSIELPLAGATSWLASGSFDTVYPGLNDFEKDMLPPINITFQAYHIMVALFGCMVLWVIFAWISLRKNKEPKKGLLRLLCFGPLLPLIAIQSGWIVTEVGRQPWIVWGELLTEDGISLAVSSTDLLLTIAVFILFYLFILIAYLRITLRFVKAGPEEEKFEEEARLAKAEEE